MVSQLFDARESCFYYYRYKMPDKDLVRVSVTVAHAEIAVRFPCSLQFQLKNQSNATEAKSSHEIKNGRCEPNERLAIEIDIDKNEDKYYNSKVGFKLLQVILQVLMVSANGRVPAGSISLPVTDEGLLVTDQNQQTRSIEKCVDKQAKITFIMKVEYIGTAKKIKNEDNLSRSAVRLNFQQSPSSGFRPTKINREASTSQLYKNKVIGSSSFVGQTRFKTQAPISITDRSSELEQKSSHNNSRDLIDEIGNEVDELRSHYELSAEQAGYRRQGQGRRGEDYLSKYRMDIQELMAELNKAKEKNRNYERRERQQAQQIKELKDQAEKARSKSTTAESVNFQVRLLLNQKQRVIAQLTQEQKTLKQYAEQLKLSFSMQEKRIDYKQSALNEQLRKLNQKYQASEQQRQKILMEMNTMLNDRESADKKNQLTLKEKEKSFVEERNRILKKVEAASAQILSLKQENQELKEQIYELKTSVKNLSKEKSESQELISESFFKIEQLTQQNKTYQAEIERLKKDREQLQSQTTLNSGLSKKLNEANIQLNKLKESEQKNIKKIQVTTKTIKEQENTIKELSAAKESMTAKNNDLVKQLQSLKKTTESKQLQIQTLKEANVASLSKIEEMKSKNEKERLNYEQIIQRCTSQAAYLDKTKDSFEAELEDCRWKLERSEELVESLRVKIAELNDRLLKNNEELLINEEKVKQYRDTQLELQGAAEELKNEIIAREQKQKDLQYQLKTKNEQQHEYRKTIGQKEQQISLLKERESQLSTLLEDSKKRLQFVTQSEQSSRTELTTKYQSLLKAFNQIKLEKEASERQKKRLQEERRQIKSEKAEAENTVSQLQAQLSQKQKTISKLQEERDQKQAEAKRNLIAIQGKQQQIASLKTEFQNYRIHIHQSFQNFVAQLTRESQELEKLSEQAKKLTEYGITFNEQKLLMFQSKALRHRKQTRNKSIQLIRNLQHTVDDLKSQLQMSKANNQKSVGQLESIIEESKQKYKQLLAVTSSEKNESLDNINSLEQKVQGLLVERQKMRLEYSGVAEELAQLKQIIKSKQEQNAHLERELQITTASKIQLQKQIQSTKKSLSDNIDSINQENRVVIQKLKNNIKENEKLITKLESEVKVKSATIQELENSLSNQEVEYDILTKKSEYAQTKIEELQETIKDFKEQIKILDQKNQTFHEQCETLRRSVQAEKFKKEDLLLRVKKLQENMESSQTEKKRFEELNINQALTIDTLKQQISKSLEKQKLLQQSSSSSVKDLNDKINTLNSEIELKQFLYKQLQNNHVETKAELAQALKEIENKKRQIHEVKQLNEKQKNNILVINQEVENLTVEKIQLSQELQQIKLRFQSLSQENLQISLLQNQIQAKTKQHEKIANQLTSLETKYQATSRQLKSLIAETKREATVKSAKQEEYKVRIRTLEKQLSNRANQFTLQKNKLVEAIEHQKLQLEHQMVALEEENHRLTTLYQTITEESQKEVEYLNQECAELTGIIAQKQELLNTKDDRIKQRDNKIKLLTLELKNCLETWEIEKHQKSLKSERVEVRAAKVMTEIESRSRTLLTFGSAGNLR